MPTLPWENGTFMPWQVGSVFIGNDGYAYQVYQDNSGVGQATGYVVKRFNPANPSEVSYAPGQAPTNTQAYADWYSNTPQGKQQKAYEDAIVSQGDWERDYKDAGLDIQREGQQQAWNIHKDDNALSRDKLKQDYEIAMRSAQSQEERDKIDAWYKYNLVQNARIELGTKLRGPENHFYYQEAAARGRANPIGNGVASWFNPNSNAVTGTGAWGGGEPTRGSLGSMGAQFGAGDTNWFGDVNSTGNATVDGNGQNDQSTLAAFNEFFKNPHKAAPGFLESKNNSQIGLMQGAADYLGHDWNTVVSRYNATRPLQGIGGNTKA